MLAPWLDADPRATLQVAPGDGGIRPVAELLDAVSPDLDAAGVRPADRAEVTPHTGIRATTLVIVGTVTTVLALVLRWLVAKAEPRCPCPAG